MKDMASEASTEIMALWKVIDKLQKDIAANTAKMQVQSAAEKQAVEETEAAVEIISLSSEEEDCSQEEQMDEQEAANDEEEEKQQDASRMAVLTDDEECAVLQDKLRIAIEAAEKACGTEYEEKARCDKDAAHMRCVTFFKASHRRKIADAMRDTTPES